MSKEFDPYYEWLGIPPKDQPPDHYRLLGIERFESNRNVIDTAANRQMGFIKEYQAGEHSELTQRLLNELASARICLLNKEKKAAYDEQLRASLEARQAPSRPPPLRSGRTADVVREDARAASEHEELVLLRVPMTAPSPAEPILPPGIDGLAGEDAEGFVPPPAPGFSASPLPATAAPSGLPRQLRSNYLVVGIAAGLTCAALAVLLALWAASQLGISRSPERLTAQREDPPSPPAAISIEKTPADSGPNNPAASQMNADHQPSGETGTSPDGTASGPPPTFPTPSPSLESAAGDAQGAEPATAKDLPAEVPTTSPATPALSVPESSAQVEPQRSPPDSAAPVESATTLSVEPRAQPRAPLPDAQALQASEKMAAEIYRARFQQAKTAADKTALATEMVEAALKIQAGSADQFILLKIAGDVAARAGDAPTAIQAAEQLAERFDMPAAKAKADALLAAAAQATTHTQFKALAQAALNVVPNLAKEGEYELALNVCETATESAQKAKESALLRKLSDAMTELHVGQERFAKYQQALTALKNDPADAAANHTAGRYRCLVEGDWERGTAMLALGNDPEVKAAAVMDQRGANSPEDQVAVGDAWWTLAEKTPEPERDALKLRAGFWYRLAEPKLAEGLAAIKVKQRLAELAKSDSRTASNLPALDSAKGALPGDQSAQLSALIADAQRSVDQQNFVEARKKLLQASQHKEDSSQAWFYLGLLSGLVEHNASDARKFFTRAQTSGSEDLACLNNLALAAVRSRDAKQAVGYWKKSIELGPTPEVAHNIGLLLRLAERNRVNLLPDQRQTLDEQLRLAGTAGTSTDERLSRSRRASNARWSSASGGWLYMDFAGEPVGLPDWHWRELSDRTCMQCNGARTAECPMRNCSRGRVRVSTVDTIPLPGGHVVQKQRLVPTACTNCGGTGRVPCPFCHNGIDRDL